jgi:NAD(P)-dependent dehydrogenase (short-subunit alcohol dehydrogenase family)
VLMRLSLAESNYLIATRRKYAKMDMEFLRLDRLQQAADELSKTTGQVCIAAQADVRQPEKLKEAVERTIQRFGRIDFVICGKSAFLLIPCTGIILNGSVFFAGAAGNFLSPISSLSENGFKTVIEIDTVMAFLYCFLETIVLNSYHRSAPTTQ